MNWRTFRLTADYLKFIRQLFILSNAERQCRILVSGTTPFRVPYSPMFRPSSSSSFLASSSGQSVAERRRVRTLVAYAPLFTVTCVTSDGNLLTEKQNCIRREHLLQCCFRQRVDAIWNKVQAGCRTGKRNDRVRKWGGLVGVYYIHT